MNRPGDRMGGAERARWLAELAQAVDQAQQLAWSLGASKANAAEVSTATVSLLTRNSTRTTPTLSLAATFTPTRPVTVDPPAGEVMETPGACVSAASAVPAAACTARAAFTRP